MTQTSTQNVTTVHKVSGFGQAEDSKITKSAAWLATACAIITKEPLYAKTFSDPYARHFAEAISDLAATELEKFNDAETRRAFIEEKENDHNGVVGTVLYRKPWFERQTERTLGNGSDQLVILGAGCDTLSLRLAANSYRPTVFELDRPEVIAFRNSVLEGVDLDLSHVKRIGLDFQQRFFGDVLVDNGYKEDKCSTFVAEGVLEYLGDAEVDAVFNFVRHKSGQGSILVFSFTEPTVNKSYSGRVTGLPLQGEARTWELTPDALEAFLDERGFDLVDVLTADKAEAEWLPKEGPTVHAVPFMHFASAQARISAS